MDLYNDDRRCTSGAYTATMSGPQKIGGEVGEVRANIDVDNLYKYLGAHVKRINLPVAVKQFKVSMQAGLRRVWVLMRACSLDRYDSL